jgi:hypothetical protein
MNVQRTPGAQESYRVTSAHASPFRAVVNMIKCCLNPKVLAGLAVVGVGVLVFAPNLAASVLPLLVVLACPLSMLFMMHSMFGQKDNSNGAACEHCAPQQEQPNQAVVIDHVPAKKPAALPEKGETIGFASERDGAPVVNPTRNR